MPYQYRVFASDNLIANRFFGHVTTQCILRRLDETEDDENCKDSMLLLEDWRDITEFTMSKADMEQFAELKVGLSKRHKVTAKMAVIASNGPGRAAARDWQKMIDARVDFSIFETVEDAADYLGLAKNGTYMRSFKLGLSVR